MDTLKALEQIANGIHAANKIKGLYNSSLREDSRSMVKQADIPMFLDALNVIVEYSPETHKKILSEVLHKSNLYGEAYRSLSQQLIEWRSRKLNKDDVFKTLNTVMPILNNRSKLRLEKVLKILEILST